MLFLFLFESDSSQLTSCLRGSRPKVEFPFLLYLEHTNCLKNTLKIWQSHKHQLWLLLLMKLFSIFTCLSKYEKNINAIHFISSTFHFLCSCMSYLAISPLYRDLYVQLAGSGLQSTQNSCSVRDWTSSNQEKWLPSLAASDLYITDVHTQQWENKTDKVTLKWVILEWPEVN